MNRYGKLLFYEILVNGIGKKPETVTWKSLFSKWTT